MRVYANKAYNPPLILDSSHKFLCCSVHQGAGAPDWVTDLTGNIQRFQENFREQMQFLNENLHREIEKSVQPALEQVQKTIENLPKGNRSQNILQCDWRLFNIGIASRASIRNKN